MNFSFYLAVAVFGNLAGWLLKSFPPESVGGALVYSRNSYLAVFSVLAFASTAVFFCAMKLRERRSP